MTSLRIGSILAGAKWRYRLVRRLGDHTVFSSVFQAEVLTGVQCTTSPKFAVVKTATDPENRVRRDSLLRERNYHASPLIQSCAGFRKLYDTINEPNSWTAERPFCLVLEWMDTTLADVPSALPLRSPVLVNIIVEAALRAFSAAAKEGLVYSDLKPSNVLLSGIDGPSPKARIGDLGLMGPDGCNEGWLQPEAFRAPEVWTSVRCYHKSDVWSLAALVLKWIDDDLLGNHDNKGPYPPMTWCLAKIMRLFNTPDDSVIPPPMDASEDIQASFNFAEKLLRARQSDDHSQFVLETPQFEEWAAAAKAMDLVPKTVVDMIRFLAVLDPAKRPTAAQALASNEFRALGTAAGYNVSLDM